MSYNKEIDNQEDNLDYEGEYNNENMNYSYSSGVVITDINIPFGDMVLILIRLSLAGIPAFLVLFCIYYLFFLAVGLIGLGTILSF
tara:strand:- start:857 stop:1114 length:258 start_codon:yes stop_codon:yes gene_type:complete